MAQFTKHVRSFLEGSVLMNASSPMRDRRFRQFVCDRTLAGFKTASARVYDVGGTGQVSVKMDRDGRIADAQNVNPNYRGALRALSDIPRASADLIIICRVIEGMCTGDAETLVRDARRVLHPLGCLMICSPDLSPLRRSIFVATGQLIGGEHFRTPDQVRGIVHRAGLMVAETSHYANRFGRSFVIFARCQSGHEIGEADA